MSTGPFALASLAEIKKPAPYSLIGGPFGSKLVQRDYEPDGIPVIRGTNLPSDQRFSFNDFVFVSPAKVERDLRGNRAFPGDIVVTQRGTLGQVGLIPRTSPFEEFVLSQSQMKLTVDETIADVDFVYYALTSPRGQHEIISRALTAGVPHINLRIFGEVTIPLPPLPTQRKIASVLSAYDDLIENNRHRIELLNEMASRIYREWFVNFRYPDCEEIALVASEVGHIPHGWDVLPLGAVADVNKGLSYSGQFLTEDGKPMANLKCFHPEGGFRREGTKPYSGPAQERHEVSPGDIIVANTDLTQAGNVIGAPALVPRMDFEDGGLISHHLFVVRPKDCQVGTAFLFEALRDGRFRDFARGHASGTTVLGLRTADFQSYPVVVPPPSLRREFEEVAQPPLTLTERLEDAVGALKTMREFLLSGLITGEIDVSDLDIAVEEVAA